MAATLLGLVQAHLLNAGASPVFDVIERMPDTLIGVGFVNRTDLQPLQPPLAQAVDAIGTVLTQPGVASRPEDVLPLAELPSFVAPLDDALEPWLLRPLQLATAVSGRVRAEADQVRAALARSLQ